MNVSIGSHGRASWSTRQLADFADWVNGYDDEATAVQDAVERAAEAPGADSTRAAAAANPRTS